MKTQFSQMKRYLKPEQEIVDRTYQYIHLKDRVFLKRTVVFTAAILIVFMFKFNSKPAVKEGIVGLEVTDWIVERSTESLMLDPGHYTHDDLTYYFKSTSELSKVSDMVVAKIIHVEDEVAGTQEITLEILKSLGTFQEKHVLKVLYTNFNSEYYSYFMDPSKGVSHEGIREGGVYVLPLELKHGEDARVKYSVAGGFDFLFEVDNHGLIHSHSNLQAYTIYDHMRVEAFYTLYRSFWDSNS